MRSRPLTDCANGRCVHEHCGVMMRDSALMMLRTLDLLDDDELSFDEKLAVMADGLFPDGVGNAAKLDEAVFDAFGIDLSGTRDHGTRCFDWKQDAGRIRSSFRMAYGVDWDDIAGTTSFSDVVDMLTSLLESSETPFQKAVYYRTATPPRETRTNADYVDAWLETRDHYELIDEDDIYGDKRMEQLLNG